MKCERWSRAKYRVWSMTFSGGHVSGNPRQGCLIWDPAFLRSESCSYMEEGNPGKGGKKDLMFCGGSKEPSSRQWVCVEQSRHRRQVVLAPPNSPESPLPYCSLRDNTLLYVSNYNCLKKIFNVSFAIISSHSVACIFIFLTLFSAKNIYIFYFNEVHFIHYFFHGGVSKKSSLYPKSYYVIS